MAAPTIRQMRARMNSGHRQVLEAIRDGRKLAATRISDANGLLESTGKPVTVVHLPN